MIEINNWQEINIINPKYIEEIPNTSEESLDIYRERYKSQVGEHAKNKFTRYNEEIFSNFHEASSLLVVGAGHSYHSNIIKERVQGLQNLSVLDIVKEASLNLREDISFHQLDILTQKLPGVYDYIFSAHTIEHFTRDQILNIILPKCLQATRKAVVFVVPYADNWGDEPSHKCRFYEDDELAAESVKWKRILNGQELVLWFEGQFVN